MRLFYTPDDATMENGMVVKLYSTSRDVVNERYDEFIFIQVGSGKIRKRLDIAGYNFWLDQCHKIYLEYQENKYLEESTINMTEHVEFMK